MALNRAGTTLDRLHPPDAFTGRQVQHVQDVMWNFQQVEGQDLLPRTSALQGSSGVDLMKADAVGTAGRPSYGTRPFPISLTG